MNFFARVKNWLRQGRLKKALAVNFRWSARRIRRFFQREQFRAALKSAYAKRLYCALGLLVLTGALAVLSAGLSGSYLADEAVLVRRLSDPDYNRENPVLSALNCFGSTNRIQVTLQTETFDNLHPQRVDLDRGNVNLVLTLHNGSILEYTLQNRRIDNFESGNTDQFTLILPDTVSAFDIASYRLTLMPDAKGRYGSWRCQWAQVSFLLGGSRTLLAKDNWQESYAFSEESKTAELESVAAENAYYSQVSELYPYVLAVCENGNETVHDKKMKSAALISLGLTDGDTLYLDVETVGLENQNTIFRDQLGTVALSEYDLLNYNGTMSLRVHFYSDYAGDYYKDYPLDSLGKDDFELGTSSTFAMTMPEGMSVFDIYSMELLVHNPTDAWAPRLMRAYLRTDYGTILELARITDTTLRATRGTCVFYRGLIDTSVSPLAFDLTAVYALPQVLKTQIEQKYGMQIAGVAYSMYFNEFNFYERQKLFYSQVKALYGETAHEES